MILLRLLLNRQTDKKKDIQIKYHVQDNNL